MRHDATTNSWGGSSIDKYYNPPSQTPNVTGGMGTMGDKDPALLDHYNEIGATPNTVSYGTNEVTNNVGPVVRPFFKEEYLSLKEDMPNDLLSNTAIRLHRTNEAALMRKPVVYTVIHKKLIVTNPDFTLEKFKLTLRMDAHEVPFKAGGWLDNYIVEQFGEVNRERYVASLESFVSDYTALKNLLNSDGTELCPTSEKARAKAWFVNLGERFSIVKDEVFVNERLNFIFNSDENLYLELENNNLGDLLVLETSYLRQLLSQLKIQPGSPTVIYSSKRERSWIL